MGSSTPIHSLAGTGPDNANFFSAMTFSWISPLIKKGNVQAELQLQRDVLPHMSRKTDAFYLDQVYEEAKTKALQRARKNASSTNADKAQAATLERGFLLR